MIESGGGAFADKVYQLINDLLQNKDMVWNIKERVGDDRYKNIMKILAKNTDARIELYAWQLFMAYHQYLLDLKFKNSATSLSIFINSIGILIIVKTGNGVNIPSLGDFINSLYNEFTYVEKSEKSYKMFVSKIVSSLLEKVKEYM